MKGRPILGSCLGRGLCSSEWRGHMEQSSSVVVLGREKRKPEHRLPPSPLFCPDLPSVSWCSLRVGLPPSFSSFRSSSKPLCALLTEAVLSPVILTIWNNRRSVEHQHLLDIFLHGQMQKANVYTEACERKRLVQNSFLDHVIYKYKYKIKMSYNCWARKMAILMSSTKAWTSVSSVFWQCYLQLDTDTSEWSSCEKTFKFIMLRFLLF